MNRIAVNNSLFLQIQPQCKLFGRQSFHVYKLQNIRHTHVLTALPDRFLRCRNTFDFDKKLFPTNPAKPVLLTSYSTEESEPQRVPDPEKDLSVARISFAYSFQFAYLILKHGKKGRDIIKKNIAGPSLLPGLKKAFLYLTECIANKELDELQDVVEDYFLQAMKHDKHTYVSKKYPEEIFPVQRCDLMLVTLTGIQLLPGAQLHSRKVVIDVRYTFCKGFSNNKELASVRNSKNFRTVNLKFSREAFENDDSSSWKISSVYFYPLSEWPGP
ncbi:uncharacterized protein LOC128243583 [Mya arenaria]|uniref:uncharacterized protein LOC128243583 n=1 Tax=Mya arenaria TaxID=6604 RepID=UPI0022E000B3|nr:uncharacterized protein LOC128243583 [Mya arenaria]